MLLVTLIIFSSFSTLCPTINGSTPETSELDEQTIETQNDIKNALVCLENIDKSNAGNISKLTTLVKTRIILKKRLVIADKRFLFHLYSIASRVERKIQILAGKSTYEKLKKLDAFLVEKTISHYTGKSLIKDKEGAEKIFMDLVQAEVFYEENRNNLLSENTSSSSAGVSR